MSCCYTALVNFEILAPYKNKVNQKTVLAQESSSMVPTFHLIQVSDAFAEITPSPMQQEV